MKNAILFIDDDAGRVENDVYELRSCGFEVHLEQSVENAFRFFDDNCNELVAVISDIMMPHGETVTSEESVDGLRTGLVVFRRVRSRCPDLPFIFFTNVTTVDDALRKHIESNERSCLYLEKRHYLSNEFAGRVKEFLTDERQHHPV